MNILISTLYYGEPQYKKCCEAIRKQRYSSISHNVIFFKNNIEAHYLLYESFFNQPNKFDILIKIDADMVLIDEHVIHRLVRPFELDDVLDEFRVQVLDYFTNSLIFGIEVFRKNLRYRKREDFFADRSITGQRRIMIDYDGLPPQAYHCYNPELKQSYTFGVHRACKGQGDILELIINHYQTTGEQMLAAACLGALDVLTNRLKVSPEDYKDIAESFIKTKMQSINSDLVSEELSRILRRKNKKMFIKNFLVRCINKSLRLPIYKLS